MSRELVVATEALAVVLDAASGRVLQVTNKPRRLRLLAAAPTAAPFRLELRETGWVQDVLGFSAEPRDDGLHLSWRARHGVVVTSEIRPRGADIVFTLAIHNGGAATISRVEYPVVAGIGRLGGAGRDELVHSHATGMLFRDPLDLFDADPENLRRLTYSPYPEGFAGSTMQMMAYYGRGVGGFFFGTEDPGQNLKAYNFFKQHDQLCCSFTHHAPALLRGDGLAVEYPVVLAAMTAGTWHEAADRYKHWALGQPWARGAPRCQWLREDVGLCTFGINASHDRAVWLDTFHSLAGTPVFHILGPNWSKAEQNYQNSIPGARSQWFPARFSQANLDTIRRNGDFWAPFEFDLLSGEDESAGEPVADSRLVLDERLCSPDTPRFPYMCAGTTYWRDLHAWRDATLTGDYGSDALYYDISVSNLLMRCLAEHHEHPPGAGPALARAFTEMYRTTKRAAARTKGSYVPAGTEVIHEWFLQDLDFYQARAEACPLAPFEVDVYRDWIVAGRAEKIPLFEYVYHDRGPLRLDGWGKLAREAGDLFYWTAARVLLNGGLFELNYEFSGLEDLHGQVDDPTEHYFPFTPRRFRIDPAKARFVGELARVRVGPANRFLAYGTMLPPPTVEAADILLDYFLYNAATLEERGLMKVPSVLAAAWEHDGEVLWLVANVSSETQAGQVEGRTVRLGPRRVAVIRP